MLWPHIHLVNYCHEPEGEGKMADDYSIKGQSPFGHE